MDDFFLIHHDKAYLQECRKQIEEFVQARGLSLNAKTNIFPLRNGVDFLGFHTYLTESGKVIRKVRRRSKNNMKRKLKKFADLQAAGKIDAKTIEQSYQSWRGHASKGNSYHLIRNMDRYYKDLFGKSGQTEAATGALPCGEIECGECPYYRESYFCGYIERYCVVFGSFENP